MRIPNKVYMDKRLTACDKLIFAVLVSAEKKGDWMPSNETIASIAGVRKETVIKSLGSFKRLGYLEVTNINGNQYSMEKARRRMTLHYE